MLCVLVLAALLGIASLVVDGGNALLQRRNQQGVADAAAMAAVKELPGSTSRPIPSPAITPHAKNSGGCVGRRPGRDDRLRSGSCDGGFGSTALGPASVCVIVHSNTNGAFSRLLGSTSGSEARVRSPRPRRSRP